MNGVFKYITFNLFPKPCPNKFKCVSSNLKLEKNAIDDNIAGLGDLKLEFIRNLVCQNDQQRRSVCLPEDGSYLFTNRNIFQSFWKALPQCIQNPCKDGKWPWYSEKDETFKCLLVTEPIDHCDGSLVESNGHIVCNFLDVKFTADVRRQKCRRSHVYSSFRRKCVPRFRGK